MSVTENGYSASNHAAPETNGNVIAQNNVTQSHMSGLVEKINSLIEDYESFVEQHFRQRESEMQTLQRKRDAARQNFQRQQADISNRRQQGQTTIDQWKQKLNEWHTEAEKHLQLQFIKPEPPSIVQNNASAQLPAAAGNDLARLWEAVQSQLSRADESLKELRKTQKPSYLVAIVGFFAAVGVIGGIIMAAYTRNTAVFLVVLVFQLIVGAGVAYFVRQMSIGKIQEFYAQWIHQKEIAESYLEQYRVINNDISDNASKAAAVQHQYLQNQIAAETDEVGKNFDNRLQDYAHHLNALTSQTNDDSAHLLAGTAFSGADWNDESWQQWKQFLAKSNGYQKNPTVKFGEMTRAARSLDDVFSNVPLSFQVPALMSICEGRGLMIKAPRARKEEAVNLIQSVMLRMLATMPPGMVRFTLFDPLGLGQNVAAFMPLGTHDEKLITSKAWSEPQKIEEELSKMTDHLSDVIQTRLRNEHKNIEEYNESVPALPEPYRVLVAIDFPVNFRADAARRLVSIAQNGSRCGVYPLIVVDTDHLEKHMPHGFNLGSLEQYLEIVEWRDGSWLWRGYDDWRILPERLDLREQKPRIDEIIENIGTQAKIKMNVKVPFSEVLKLDKLTEDQFWKGSTKDSVKIPLGQLNSTEAQTLSFGGQDDKSHHGIIIGRTGSGKSKLMDVIITTLALKYSPAEMQFYLIDLKSGVGFKPYAEAKLPHARLIAIDSEREYALSVLRDLEGQMEKRNETFREINTRDITEYLDEIRRRGLDAVMPRILLVVDEFQNLFLEDDQIGREAGRILERLTREARSAGIHVLLGSQSLAGKAAQLPTAALSQIGIRIALMCNAADARAIMADDNSEARLLSRPGEAIYNDHNGLIEGNKRFQVAFLNDEMQKNYLRLIAEKAAGLEIRQMIFEGNEMARLEACKPFQQLLDGETETDAGKIKAWLGEPISISEPVAASFRRQSGNNLLVVASKENEGVGMLTSAWLSLAAQHHPDKADFYVLNFTNIEENWHHLIQEIGKMLPHKTKVFGRSDLTAVLQELSEECKKRLDDATGDGKKKYFLIYGLQRAKDLRPDEGGGRYSFSSEDKKPNVAELFGKLLRDGAESGIHVLAWCDMATNVKRTLGRNLINEFNYRAATMMSQDDSQNILESSAASKLDRAHRALFYDEDRPGHLEKFRPFAIPADASWLEQRAKKLRAYHGQGQAV
jgi:S-DNA-T family DNA segregation ATPase FtsK/SpoIIIE